MELPPKRVFKLLLSKTYHFHMKIDVHKLTKTKKTALGIPGPSFPSLQSIHSPHQPIPVIPPIPLILPIPSIPFNPISTTLYHNTLSVFGSGEDCERI